MCVCVCVFVSVHCFHFWHENKTLYRCQPATPPEKINKNFYYVSEIPDSRAKVTIVGIIPGTWYLYRK